MIFGRKKDEDLDTKDGYSEDDDLEEQPRKIRDLKPENRRARKEPIKPWGKKERLIQGFWHSQPEILNFQKYRV